MCFFFGLYVNGVAIFGRDPIMTCAVTFYQSSNQNCPYYPAAGHDDSSRSTGTTNSSWDNYTFQDLLHDTLAAANAVVDHETNNGGGCVAR
jgi:hypothetical protein